MAKNKISEYSSTSANNTDISNINIAEGCSPANLNNAVRTLMAQLKDQQAGTSGDPFTVGGNLTVTGTTTLSTALPVASGGTGSTTATNARTALSAAKSGANSDITSITGLTTPLTTAQGGTGTASTTFANLTTNVTGTLPVANGGTGVTTSTGSGANVLGTSPTIATPTITTPVINSATFNPSGSAPVFAARAWVAFDGTRDSSGATTSANTNRFIYGSGNVTSVLKTNTGIYTITFTTDLPDANYAILTNTGSTSTNAYPTSNVTSNLITTSSFQMVTGSGDTGNRTDRAYNSAVVFR